MTILDSKFIFMKKVLISLDYGHSTEKVAQLGYELAQSMHAQATLLHVISDVTYYSSLNYSPILGFESFSNLDVMQTQAVDDVKRAAGEFLNKAKQNLGGKDIQIMVVEGEFADSIIREAEAMQADIIVMGTHSRTGIDKIIMGSVTEQVLRKSTIPVFVIPIKFKDGE